MNQSPDILEIKRRNATWRSELFLAALDQHDTQELLREGYEFSRSYKVLELHIATGRIIAKVQSEISNPTRIEIVLNPIPTASWEATFEALNNHSALYAYFLAKLFPEELNTLLERGGVTLFPKEQSELLVFQDGKPSSFSERQVAAMLCRLVDKLDTDPFAMFALRGITCEEALLMIRKIRAKFRPQGAESASVSYQDVSYEAATPLEDELGNYWTLATELQSISYNLKADELPAAVLKRLDPLPLGGLEEEIDYTLQQAYAHVATRAQAFALGL